LCLRGEGHLCPNGSFTREGFRVGGEEAYAMGGIGSFSEQVLLSEAAAVRIDPAVPWEVAALLGCGVTTGVGAVLNAAHLRPGSSVVVFGCGGVGISVIQGARLAGAAEIVAVDVEAAQREQALRFGATAVAAPGEIEPGTFDYGFEAVGDPATIRAAYEAVRRGGTTVVVGVGRRDQPVLFDAFELAHDDKTMRGSWFGSADPRTEFARVLYLWRTGRLDLEGMISQRGTLDDVNAALATMRAGGGGIRTVLTL
jgi:S-(hydroxymethyl)glutathione dehydrogenase/alcohol dehydrogenase